LHRLSEGIATDFVLAPFVHVGIAVGVYATSTIAHERNPGMFSERFECQARGGPRCRLSVAKNCGTGATATAGNLGASTGATAVVDATPRAELPCLLSARGCAKGQQGTSDRNPSGVAGALQWCWPVRRQQAGAAACTCSRGRVNPASNIASSRLATERRMSRGIVLHHNDV
jgi:hypothetical protein